MHVRIYKYYGSQRKYCVATCTSGVIAPYTICILLHLTLIMSMAHTVLMYMEQGVLVTSCQWSGLLRNQHTHLIMSITPISINVHLHYYCLTSRKCQLLYSNCLKVP